MANFFENIALLLLTPDCYDQYFLHFNFLHGQCMKATISKALGFLIIAASLTGMTVKLPQILKMVKNKSQEGLSLFGNILDLSALTFMFLYSYLSRFPFSAWGEMLFLTLQTVIIISLIFQYKNQMVGMILFLLIYSTVTMLILFEIIPLSFLRIMQIFYLPIIVFGKGMQAMANYKNQSTGQLSAITLWMQFIGSLTRIFTSLQETGDSLIIASFVTSSILNGIIVFQLFYYGKSSEKKRKTKGKETSKYKKKN